MKKDTIDIIKFPIDTLSYDSTLIEAISCPESNNNSHSIAQKTEEEQYRESLDWSIPVWSLVLTVFSIFISICVSILVVKYTFKKSESLREKNKKDELDQYKFFIIEWIDKSKPTLDDYIASLKIFAENVKNNEDMNIARKKQNIVHITRIKDIQLEKYADIFVFNIDKNKINENRKNLMNLLYQIDYIELALIELKKIHKEYCFENNKVMDEWNYFYMQLNDLFFMNPNIDKLPSDAVSLIIRKIIDLYIPLIRVSKDGDFIGTTVWTEKFILPALTILCSPIYSESALLLDITRIIKGLQIAIMKHQKINSYSISFNSYAENLQTAEDDLMESLRHFR